jgi:anti-sigma regulatory factor (Ser/Thr protein kinase)
MDIVGKVPEVGSKLIDEMLGELHSFTGDDWEQEDDITLVTLQRSFQGSEERKDSRPVGAAASRSDRSETLADFTVSSVQGNERIALEKVADAVADLGIPDPSVERLKTAVAEATMNAIEHGNQNREELPVAINVSVSADDLFVKIVDQGGGREIVDAETPDIEAKLAGLQTPRGWGLFLIENMVDEMNVSSDDDHHTIELILHLKGDANGSQRA